MLTLSNFLTILLAYFIGSIPTAVWIGRYFYKVDVREHGSGNSGATNTFRVLGKRAGLPVLIIDVLKGWGSVNLAYLVSESPGNERFLELQMVLGIAALLGHIFPVLAAFRGGKGIATLLGVTLALHPQAALVCIGVFALVFLLTNYVSLSSMVSALSFPVSLMFFFPTGVPSFVAFSLFLVAIVLLTHQKNIERLINREESKIHLLRKRPASRPREADEE
ncbi:MAG: glycerol-3-phosphate 1-O-acyltransferase PlsY [Bacteroidia bacterium]|nr:glycerol-3-phosphate 1-O-acyltransferase PlsY [Bacteroidia bacterium]